MSSRNGISVSEVLSFVMHKDLPPFLFDIVVIPTNGKPLLKWSSFIFFPSSATILLVVWSANGDAMISALTSNVSSNLQNDDTY